MSTPYKIRICGGEKMKVKCVSIPFMWNDMLTIGKEYEVGEVEYDEFWIEDDKENYNPIPQDCFVVVSK